MTELHSKIKIHATPEKVWKTLTDFKRYHGWNPFITRIRGELTSGEHLDLRILLRSQSERTLRCRLINVEPLKEIRWHSRLWIVGLLEWQVSFMIEQSDAAQVTFSHRQQLWGLLVPLLWPFIKDDALAGVEQMSLALKRLVEK